MRGTVGETGGGEQVGGQVGKQVRGQVGEGQACIHTSLICCSTSQTSSPSVTTLVLMV